MELIQLLQAIGIGGGSAVAFQTLKGDWNRWLTIFVGVGLAALAGYSQGGNQGAIISALGALSTHSVLLADTPLGKALKIHVGSGILNKLAELLQNVAKAIENKPNA